MKKKILAITLCVAMLAIMIVSGTLAYFTDTEAAKNVMTVGNVDIEQNEYQREFDEAGKVTGFVAFNPTTPIQPMGDNPKYLENPINFKGDNIEVFQCENARDKIVTVTNNGNVPAYVRTIVAIEAGKSAEKANYMWYKNIAVNQNTSDIETAVTCVDNDMYVKIGDSYYIILIYTYTEELAPGAESEASITGVALYSRTTQEDIAELDGDLEVLVLSQACQADGMGEDAGVALNKAFGEVTAENVATWFADIA